MQRYIDISEDQALRLREGLELLETLDRDAVKDLDLYLYGITSDPQILDAAREAIAETSEEIISEEDVQLSEIAIAIPISSDTIYALTGSGIRLEKEYFAYISGEGEGARRTYLYSANYHPTVTLHSFQHIALGESDSWIDDYLEKEGSKQPAEIKKKVQRTEDATRPVPTVAEPQTPVEAPPAAPQAPQAGVPKRTSLNLASLVEDFLG
jgi:hypothetical protein